MQKLKHALSILVFASGSFICAGSSTNYFGFTGPETFPIDDFIGQMRCADLNGDGLMDLVVANNSRSKITLLYNQTGQTNAVAAKRIKTELNELPPDARFRIDSIASEKRIAALVVADLNDDQRPDLAYYGEPKELVVQYNQGTNGWSLAKRWPIDKGQLSPNALSTGDLNGDGRADLLLLGEDAVYWFAQQPDHILAEPVKIPFSGTVKSAQILDVDGDGLEDLFLVNWDMANPFRFRLQTRDGHLGPEIHFALPPIRSYWADDLDGDHKTELITIAQNSGRAQIANFVLKAAEPLNGSFKIGQFSVLPLNKTDKANRGICWGDVNHDQLPDLLVAEPETGQLSVFLQEKDGSLGARNTFPSFSGVTELLVGQEDGTNGAPIYVLSGEERQVGMTRYGARGRVAFPTPIPLEGKPLTMALGPLKAGAQATLAVILDQDGKRVLFTRQTGGETDSQKLSEDFKSNPSTMTFHDVNQDGLTDLVILIPYEKIKILLQAEHGPFQELDVAPPGGSVEQPWLSVADVDGDGHDELLLAQKNFLRAVVLQPEQRGSATNWTFRVKDQINGSAGNSRIVAAAPLRNGTNNVDSLFLLDAERKVATFSERSTNGVWEVVRNIELPFTDFHSLRPLALGQTNYNTLGFMGLNAVGWLALDGKRWSLEELDGYETPIKDGHLNDVVSGDLNQDHRKDLVFLETAKNYLDLVAFNSNRELIPATRWQVFEERTFRSRRSESPEPREALIADFTGDGKNDLAVLVHDRILLYPQE